jgi:hypothetical protein
MPGRYELTLTGDQVSELEQIRDHAAKPHLREKAAAILKVHAQQSMRQVALGGLLKAHKPHTIKAWIQRYLAQGPAGLAVQAGRGRRRLFFPPHSCGGQASGRTIA